LGDTSDLSQALALLRQVLALLSPDHNDYQTCLQAQALLQSTRHSDESSVNNAVKCLREALSYSKCYAQRHFVASIRVLEQIDQHSESASVMAQLLAVYRTAIRALPRVAFFGLNNRNRLRVLYKAKTLASNACCLAISQGDVVSGVELLEKGRAVFWTQYLRLRDDLAELPPDASERLKATASQLQANGPDTFSSKAVREEEQARRRQLSDEFETLIQSLGLYPGFETFVQGHSFNTLSRMA
jgi:hypothetical protein